MTKHLFFYLIPSRTFWDFLQDEDKLSGIHASITSGQSQRSLVSVPRYVKVLDFIKFNSLLIFIAKILTYYPTLYHLMQNSVHFFLLVLT